MNHINLYQKLSLIRDQISVKKTGFNKFGNYSYYEIDEIYKAAKKLFLKHGIFTTFSLNNVGDENKHLRAILKVINVDNPEEHFDMTLDSGKHYSKDKNGQPSGSPCQWVGANNTYQSKYLYMDLLMLDDGSDDPDMKETHGAKQFSQTSVVRNRPAPKKELSIEDEFL